MITFHIILIVIGAVVLLYLGYIIGKKAGALIADARWQKKLPDIRADAAKRSRAVIGGQFSEQLAPYLPDFPYNPSEVKFLGKPIDFIVFKGLDEKTVSEVVFVEVKSGGSRLSSPERSLRDAIKAKKVSWEEYRIPEGLTR